MHSAHGVRRHIQSVSEPSFTLPTRRTVLQRISVAVGLLMSHRYTAAQPTAKTGKVSAEELRALIGKASRLSVLSDRVTRCQVQRSLKVLIPRAERQLDDTRREVRKVLGELSAAGLPEEALRHLTTGRDAYESFLRKSGELDVSTTGGLLSFAEDADVVGTRMDTLVRALVQATNRVTSQALATTADLQRLTQHAAVHFLLASAGIQADMQMKEVNQARTEFNTRLAALTGNFVRNEAIDNQIKLLEPQWLLMSAALSNPGRDMRTMENICTTSERLLEVTTSLYGLYDSALTT